MAVLIALEGIGGGGLADVPSVRTTVVLGDIHQEALLVLGTEGIAVVGTTQGGGKLGLYVVSLQEDAIVAGMGLFLLVTEPRAVVVGIEAARYGQHGDMQLVPMALGGMGEAIDLMVFVLIAAAAVIHGDGCTLHHSIRHRCTGEGLGSPGTFHFGAGVSQFVGCPQGGGSEEGITVLGKITGICAKSRK